MNVIENIEKENIPNLKFNRKEVLERQEDIETRMSHLYRGLLLGNLLHEKVKIIFESADQKIYQVNTTIWSIASDFITLKGSVAIPVNSILEVD
ncbi:hypothetical protein [Echinicola sp. 20G]|uniref:hypothetical protein n=1 Tax=Echinicola sp. 20G TaxID=2781961 RepID=UPI001910AD35|nr:hypothetical protein [Echinicola sp. 20G]